MTNNTADTTAPVFASVTNTTAPQTTLPFQSPTNTERNAQSSDDKPNDPTPPIIGNALDGIAREGDDSSRLALQNNQDSTAQHYVGRNPLIGSTLALIANVPLPELQMTPGSALTFTLPIAAFLVNDPNSNVTVTLSLAGGNAVPSWLRFDPVSGTLTGTPPAGSSGTLKLVFIARDDRGNSATSTMDIQLPAQASERNERERRADIDLEQLLDALLAQDKSTQWDQPPVDFRQLAAQGRTGLDAQFASHGRGDKDPQRLALLAQLAAVASTTQASEASETVEAEINF